MEAVERAARLDTLQRIELAEGVNIRLRVAGLPVRIMAFLLDQLICVGIMILALIIISIVGFFSDFEGAIGLFLLIWFLIRWFYHLPFETGKKGATPGKRMMKLRVVRTTGTPISVGQSMVRNLLRFVDEMPAFIAAFPIVPTYLFGSVVVVCSKRSQRLGDLAAGTIVVYAHETASSHLPLQAIPLPGQAYAYQQPPTLPPGKTPPNYPLHRDEQLAFLRFRERLPLWTSGRQAEIADHLSPLTEKTGPEGVQATLSISNWIEESK